MSPSPVDIEGPAAKIVDSDAATLFFVETVSEGGSRRLVDQAKDFEARDFAGVFGGLALRIVEISRNGNDGAIDGFTEEGFGPVFQFAQNKRGYLWRSK